jgi:RNA polymerase sigma-70 factor (ECF subfamily)
VLRLQQEYQEAGKAALFMALRFAIAGDCEPAPYAKLARTLRMGEPAVRVAVCRLRRRYREVLCQEIAQTVATAEDVEDELRQLGAALAMA